MYIFTHNPNSMGARRLADALGVRRIRHQGSSFTGRGNPIVLNWGATDRAQQQPWYAQVRWINHPAQVRNTNNKRTFFEIARAGRASVPPFTPDRNEAEAWLNNPDVNNEGARVVCRTLLQGHNGDGIVIAARAEQLVDAPLYVLYVPKKEEYRVHVFDGNIIDIQRKARRRDVPDDEVNWQVRNHANGFIYAREEGLGDVPNCVQQVSLGVMELFGLEFGAVDVVYNSRHDRAFVLEINSAPGLEGTTVDKYAEAVKEVVS